MDVDTVFGVEELWYTISYAANGDGGGYYAGAQYERDKDRKGRRRGEVYPPDHGEILYVKLPTQPQQLSPLLPRLVKGDRNDVS